MNMFFGADHAGYPLKKELLSFYPDALDLGTHSTDSVDYPDLVNHVIYKVQEGFLGILICGTGIGMSIRANRYPFVRAALCINPYEAMMAREHNDANVLCLGSRVIGFGVAKMCIDIFLKTSFDDRHKRRVSMLGADIS